MAIDTRRQRVGNKSTEETMQFQRSPFAIAVRHRRCCLDCAVRRACRRCRLRRGHHRLCAGRQVCSRRRPRDGVVKVLSIEGKKVTLIDHVKVGERRLSGISFTHDGKAAIVALRDENGAAVLSVEGTTVKLTNERISTGVSPYAVDVSSDG